MEETKSSRSPGAEASLAGKYLTFTLCQEHYGITVVQVCEIIRHTTITPVPHTEDAIKGVLNLRGKVIPIVDLRIKLHMDKAEIAERTCIIVAQVKMAAGNRTMMGFIVDSVEAVAHINADEIEETPDFGSGHDTEFILGMAKQESKVVALLNLDEVAGAEAARQSL